MHRISLLLLLGTSNALAQPTDAAPPDGADAPPPTSSEPATAAPTTGQTAATATERTVMPKGRALVRGVVEVNLSKESAGDPISIAPDVWYGIDDRITVGLVHSFSGASGVMGGFGSSLCIAGDGCGDVYNGFGIDGRYHLVDGAFTFAANAGVYVAEFDPFQLAIKLGIVGRWRPSPTSKLAVDVAPNFVIGLTEREPEPGGPDVELESNKETVVLPATAWYTVIPKLSLGLQAAFVTPLDGAAEQFLVPVSIGASYKVNDRLLVDLAFSLLSVAGGSEVEATGVDARSITIGGSYAL